MLASLSFALEHAARHGLRRIVYFIPFTSIIEQTAQVFRQALGSADDVLEHHSSVAWTERDDSEGRDGGAKLRRAAANLDVPVVVTTAVQFFESLFAARPSRCRKLHNLASAGGVAQRPTHRTRDIRGSGRETDRLDLRSDAAPRQQNPLSTGICSQHAGGVDRNDHIIAEDRRPNFTSGPIRNHFVTTISQCPVSSHAAYQGCHSNWPMSRVVPPGAYGIVTAYMVWTGAGRCAGRRLPP